MDPHVALPGEMASSRPGVDTGAQARAHWWAGSTAAFGHRFDKVAEAFLVHHYDRLRVTEPVFTGGTMAWLDEVEDALLLIDYEESHGHVAVLLEDVDLGLWVVLSSRRFRGRRRGWRRRSTGRRRGVVGGGFGSPGRPEGRCPPGPGPPEPSVQMARRPRGGPLAVDAGVGGPPRIGTVGPAAVRAP